MILDALETVVRMFVRLRLVGVVVLLALVTLLAVAIGAVVAKVHRVLRRRRHGMSID